jgi:hypothetical protein
VIQREYPQKPPRVDWTVPADEKGPTASLIAGKADSLRGDLGDLAMLDQVGDAVERGKGRQISMWLSIKVS